MSRRVKIGAAAVALLVGVGVAVPVGINAYQDSRCQQLVTGAQELEDSMRYLGEDQAAIGAAVLEYAATHDYARWCS